MIDESFVDAISRLGRSPHVVQMNGHDLLLVPVADGWEVQEPVPRKEPAPHVLAVETLSGLAQYVTENRDRLELNTMTMVVDGPTGVVLVGPLTSPYAVRLKYAAAACSNYGSFPFGNWIDHETLMIAAQAYLAETPAKEEFLAFVGNIRSEYVNQSTDDGVSQSVAVRKGAVLVEATVAPRRVRLAPYRTFPEIVQPESEFVLRLRGASKEGERPQFALFPADGGRWRLEAQERIAVWLHDHVPKDISIIY